MERPAQLAALQSLMDSQRHLEEVMSTNEKLRVSLAGRADSVKRLLQLSIATASLITSVDSGAPETEPSSLQVLTKLGSSNAVTPDPEDPEPDLSKAITGKFLSQLLALVVQGARQKKGAVGLLDLVALEQELHRLLRKAEDNELIPKTEEKASWKKKSAEHQRIYDQIAQIRESRDDDGGADAEEEDKAD
jgi:hypothetical protein